MVILDTFNFGEIEEPSFCCVAVSASIVTFGSEKKGALLEGHISYFLLTTVTLFILDSCRTCNTSSIRVKHVLGI